MPDNKDKVAILHEAVSKNYDIGTLDEFKKKLSIPEKRKAFYDVVGKEYELGSFDEFESKITPVKKKTESSVGAFNSDKLYNALGSNKIKSPKDYEQDRISPTKPAKIEKDVVWKPNNEQKGSVMFSGEHANVVTAVDKSVIQGTSGELRDADKQKGSNFEQGFKVISGSGMDAPASENKLTGSELMDIVSNSGVDLASTILKGATTLLTPMEGAVLSKDLWNPVNNHLDKAQKSAQASTDRLMKSVGYEGSPTEAITQGDYLSAFELVGKSAVQSLPVSVALSNPYTASLWAVGNVKTNYDDLIKEGVDPINALSHATLTTGAEFFVDRFLGGAKHFKQLISSGGKDAVKVYLKQSLVKELGKSAAGNIGGEEIENSIDNLSQRYILGKKDVGVFDNWKDTALTSFGMSKIMSPIVVINTLRNNAIVNAEEQAKSSQSQGQQAQLDAQSKVPPIDNELPPANGGAEQQQSQTAEQQEQDPIVTAIQQNPENITDSNGNKVQVTDIAPNGVIVNDTIIPFNEVFVQGVPLDEISTTPTPQEQEQQQEQQAQLDAQSKVPPIANELPPTTGGAEQQQEQQEQQPLKPKKIYHYTSKPFTGLPTPQKTGVASTYGNEPMGTFYHTDKGVAEQAVGSDKQGEAGRLIEAEYNPKNPLVTTIDSPIYVEVENEAQHRAVEQFLKDGIQNETLTPEMVDEINAQLEQSQSFEEFTDSTGLGDIINPLIPENITNILKEKGYDAVEFTNNGDVVILDQSAVSEIPTDKTQVQEKKDEIESIKEQLSKIKKGDSSLNQKERDRIKGLDRHSLSAKVRGWFLDGGKINWEDVKSEIGIKEGEWSKYLGISSKTTGKTIDQIAHSIGGQYNLLDQSNDVRNEIINILNEPRNEWYTNQAKEDVDYIDNSLDVEALEAQLSKAESELGYLETRKQPEVKEQIVDNPNIDEFDTKSDSEKQTYITKRVKELIKSGVNKKNLLSILAKELPSGVDDKIILKGISKGLIGKYSGIFTKGQGISKVLKRWTSVVGDNAKLLIDEATYDTVNNAMAEDVATEIYKNIPLGELLEDLDEKSLVGIPDVLKIKLAKLIANDIAPKYTQAVLDGDNATTALYKPAMEYVKKMSTMSGQNLAAWQDTLKADKSTLQVTLEKFEEIKEEAFKKHPHLKTEFDKGQKTVQEEVKKAIESVVANEGIEDKVLNDLLDTKPAKPEKKVSLKDKLALAKEKRNQNKGRTLNSTLDPADVEYIIDITRAYIEEGIKNVKRLVDLVTKSFEENELSDELKNAIAIEAENQLKIHQYNNALTDAKGIELQKKHIKEYLKTFKFDTLAKLSALPKSERDKVIEALKAEIESIIGDNAKADEIVNSYIKTFNELVAKAASKALDTQLKNLTTKGGNKVKDSRVKFVHQKLLDYLNQQSFVTEEQSDDLITHLLGVKSISPYTKYKLAELSQELGKYPLGVHADEAKRALLKEIDALLLADKRAKAMGVEYFLFQNMNSMNYISGATNGIIRALISGIGTVKVAAISTAINNIAEIRDFNVLKDIASTDGELTNKERLKTLWNDIANNPIGKNGWFGAAKQYALGIYTNKSDIGKTVKQVYKTGFNPATSSIEQNKQTDWVERLMFDKLKWGNVSDVTKSIHALTWRAVKASNTALIGVDVANQLGTDMIFADYALTRLKIDALGRAHAEAVSKLEGKELSEANGKFAVELYDTLAKAKENLTINLSEAMAMAKAEYEQMKSDGLNPTETNIKYRAWEILTEVFDAEYKTVVDDVRRRQAEAAFRQAPKGLAGKFSKVILGVTSYFPESKFATMFMNTGLNALSRGLEYTPIGLMRSYMDNHIGGELRTTEEKAKSFNRAITGMSIFALYMFAYSDDDDEDDSEGYKTFKSMLRASIPIRINGKRYMADGYTKLGAISNKETIAASQEGINTIEIGFGNSGNYRFSVYNKMFPSAIVLNAVGVAQDLKKFTSKDITPTQMLKAVGWSMLDEILETTVRRLIPPSSGGEGILASTIKTATALLPFGSSLSKEGIKTINWVMDNPQQESYYKETRFDEGISDQFLKRLALSCSNNTPFMYMNGKAYDSIGREMKVDGNGNTLGSMFNWIKKVSAKPQPDELDRLDKLRINGINWTKVMPKDSPVEDMSAADLKEYYAIYPKEQPKANTQKSIDVSLQYRANLIKSLTLLEDPKRSKEQKDADIDWAFNEAVRIVNERYVPVQSKTQQEFMEKKEADTDAKEVDNPVFEDIKKK